MTRYLYILSRTATVTRYRVLLLLCFLAIGWIISWQLQKRNDNFHDADTMAAGTVPAGRDVASSWMMTPAVNNNNVTSSLLMQELWIPMKPDTTIRKKLRQTIPLAETVSSRLLDNCHPTAQLVLQIVSYDKKDIHSHHDHDHDNDDDPKIKETKWILRSLDETKTPKTVGHDEFYITWQEQQQYTSTKHPSAVALIHDRNDGSYELEFVMPPPVIVDVDVSSGSTVSSSSSSSSSSSIKTLTTSTNVGSGNLTIYYQYTCGMGNMAPPSKDDWNDGGALFQRYTVEVPQRPSIRSFHHQSLIDPVTQQPLSLSNYQQVLVFGDSAMRQFVKNTSRTYQPNLVFRTKRRKPWTTALMEEHLMVLEKQLGRDLDKAANQSPHATALLVGSSIWDVLASTKNNDFASSSSSSSLGVDSQKNVFDDHLKACRHFVIFIRHRYPNVDILWKSPTAMHIHVVVTDPSDPTKNTTENIKLLLDRVRYMSTSRMGHLYQLQRQLMQELQIPFLDIYEATYLSASWTFPGDGRHYLPELNKQMLNWFYG